MKQQSESLVSLVTVVLNDPEGLELTLNSIVSQNFKNKQIVVIDGGSEQETLDIIHAYKDKIDYWSSAPDEGIYDAMNKGIRQVKGDWLQFLNAGDAFFDRNSLKQIVSGMDEQYSFAYSDVFYEDLDGQRFLSPQKPLFRFGIFTSIHHQATFYNVKKLGVLLQFDTRYEISADAALLLDIHFVDKKKCEKKIDKALVVYKMGGYSERIFSVFFSERRLQFKEKLKNPFSFLLNNINLLRQEMKFKRKLKKEKK